MFSVDFSACSVSGTHCGDVADNLSFVPLLILKTRTNYSY